MSSFQNHSSFIWDKINSYDLFLFSSAQSHGGIRNKIILLIFGCSYLSRTEPQKSNSLLRLLEKVHNSTTQGVIIQISKMRNWPSFLC